MKRKKDKVNIADCFLLVFAFILSLLSLLVKDYITLSISIMILALAIISILVQKICKKCIDDLEKK